MGVPVETLPSKLLKIPNGILSEDSNLKPLKPPATIFLSVLQAVLVDVGVEYLCLGFGGSDTAPVSMSRNGCGVRLQLTPSCSWALARWLKIEALHGCTLGAEELCNFIRSWAFQDFQDPQKKNLHVAFEGVTGITDQSVTIRNPKTSEELHIIFDHAWYNIMGRLLDLRRQP
jgi:hypothetical protein